jgi:hypothetical protein
VSYALPVVPGPRVYLLRSSSVILYPRKHTYMSCRRSVFSYTLCVLCRLVHFLGCFWRRLFCSCASSGSGVPCLDRPHLVSVAEPVTKYKSNISLAFHDDIMYGRTDLSNEGGLLGRDPCLCGMVTNFLSELSGRGFSLDDGGGWESGSGGSTTRSRSTGIEGSITCRKGAPCENLRDQW